MTKPVTTTLRPSHPAHLPSDLPSTRVNLLSVNELSSGLIEQWRNLENKSVESNAFLSPSFVLPALQYLSPELNPEILTIEHTGPTGTILVGLGIFNHTSRNRNLPTHCYSAYVSRHSYLSGMLIHKNYTHTAIQTFVEFLCNVASEWNAVYFRHINADSVIFSELMVQASESGFKWFENDSGKRAILNLPMVEPTLSRRKHKDIRRKIRRLKEFGKLEWTLKKNQAISPESIDQFLRFEDTGWRRKYRKSLSAKSMDAVFFRDMIKDFSQHDGAFITELSIDGKVIASTSNLFSGDTGFAFKLGWDTEYSKMSPGFLNEYRLINNVSKYYSDMKILDYCTAHDSFINQLIFDKRTIVSGHLALTSPIKSMLSAIQAGKKVKRWFNSRH